VIFGGTGTHVGGNKDRLLMDHTFSSGSSTFDIILSSCELNNCSYWLNCGQ